MSMHRHKLYMLRLTSILSLLMVAGLVCPLLPSPHSCLLVVLVLLPHAGSLTEARLKISLHDLLHADKQGVVMGVSCI